MNMVYFCEDLECVIDIHFENFRDRVATSFDIEDLRFVSVSVTGLTLDIGVGEELQLDFFIAISLTCWTGSFR